MFRKIKGCITRLPRAKYSFIPTLLTFFRNLKFIVMKNSWAWYAFLIPFLTHVLWGGVSIWRQSNCWSPRRSLLLVTLFDLYWALTWLIWMVFSKQWWKICCIYKTQPLQLNFIKISAHYYQQLSSHCYSLLITIHNLRSTRVYEFTIYNYSGKSFDKCTCNLQSVWHE
jgi:hypothetical protein